jgi:hypothetical protein
LQVELWPIERPRPYEKNPRQISDEGLAKIAASIKEFGFRGQLRRGADVACNGAALHRNTGINIDAT